MAWRGEVEDGTGWGGLVASKSEQREEVRLAALGEALDEKRALRNRLVAEIAKHLPGDYESRIAEAEAKVIEFEDALRAAMRRRKQDTPPNP